MLGRGGPGNGWKGDGAMPTWWTLPGLSCARWSTCARSRTTTRRAITTKNSTSATRPCHCEAIHRWQAMVESLRIEPAATISVSWRFDRCLGLRLRALHSLNDVGYRPGSPGTASHPKSVIEAGFAIARKRDLRELGGKSRLAKAAVKPTHLYDTVWQALRPVAYWAWLATFSRVCIRNIQGFQQVESLRIGLTSCRQIGPSSLNSGTLMTRILIADDHDVVRVGLRTILESQPGWSGNSAGKVRHLQGCAREP